jgi:hypothetical protein
MRNEKLSPTEQIMMDKINTADVKKFLYEKL